MVPGARLVAVTDVVRESAKELAGRYGCAAEPDLDALLARPDVDVVSICVPSGLHAEAGTQAVAAGKPVVAAVHGAAIGGGLGLACSADFRVGCPEARFAANFARLGFHHGFGLTVTLPAIVGQQQSMVLLYTGRRIGGEQAAGIGLCDLLVPADHVRAEAHALAAEIAVSAPLAVRSIRATMRGDLAGRIRAATDREAAEQGRLLGERRVAVELEQPVRLAGQATAKLGDAGRQVGIPGGALGDCLGAGVGGQTGGVGVGPVVLGELGGWLGGVADGRER